MASLPEAVSGTRQLRFATAELLVGSRWGTVPHCNREEFVSVAKPDCRFSHTLAVYLLQRLVFTKTLRLFEDRLLLCHDGGAWLESLAAAGAGERAGARLDVVWWGHELAHMWTELVP